MEENIELKLTRDEVCELIDAIHDGIARRKESIAECKKRGYYTLAEEYEVVVSNYVRLKRKVLDAKYSFNEAGGA